MVVVVQRLTRCVPAAASGKPQFVVRSRRNRNFRGARVALFWSTFSSRFYFGYYAKMRSSQTRQKRRYRARKVSARYLIRTPPQLHHIGHMLSVIKVIESGQTRSEVESRLSSRRG